VFLFLVDDLRRRIRKILDLEELPDFDFRLAPASGAG